MNHYLDSFDSQNSRYTASLHHAPFYLLAPHGVLTAFETPDKIRRTMRRWRRTLNYNGYDHTEWVSVHVQPMSDDTAIVSTVFQPHQEHRRIALSGRRHLYAAASGWRVEYPLDARARAGAGAGV